MPNPKIPVWTTNVRKVLGGRKKHLGTPKQDRLLKQMLKMGEAIQLLPASGTDGITAAHALVSNRHASLKGSVEKFTGKTDKKTLTKADEDVVALAQSVATLASYVRARETALVHERELSVLNRDGSRHEQPITQLLTDADKEAKAGKVAEATKTLATSDQVAKDQHAEIKSGRDNLLSDAKLKPLYLNKRARITSAVDQLTALPGTQEARTRLQGLLDAGKKEEKPGNYQNAYNKLKGLHGTLADGLKASEEFPRKAGGKKFESALELTEKAHKGFDTLASYADPAQVATFRQDIDKAVRSLEGKPSEQQVKDAVTELERIGNEIVSKTKASAKHAETWDTDHPGVVTDVRKFGEAAPLTAYEGLLAELRAAETLHGLQDHARAVVQLGSVRTTLTSESPKYVPHRNDWVKASTEAEKHFDELNDLFINSPVQSLRQAVGVVLQPYIGYRQTVATSHDYKDAAAAAKAVQDGYTAISKLKKDFAGVARQRSEGDGQLGKDREALRLAIQQAQAQGVDVTAAQDALSQAQKLWSKACDTESDAGKLTTALADARKLATDATLTLRDLLADPKTKDARDGFVTVKASLDTFALSRGQAERALAALNQEYPDDAGPLQNEFDGIVLLAQPSIDQGLEVPKAQIDAIKLLLGKVQKKQDERTKAVGTKANTARNQVNNALERLKKIRKDHARFGPYFVKLEADLKDCVAMANSSVAKVVEASVERLSANGDLFTLLASLEAGVEFTAIDTAIKSINEGIDDAGVKAAKRAKRKALQTRMKEEVLPDAYTRTPTDALKVLNKFLADDVKVAVDEAKAAQAQRLQIQQLVKDANTLMETFPKDIAPKVATELAGRISAAAKPGEGREYDSVGKLKVLKQIISDLSKGDDNSDKALLEKESIAQTNALNAAQAKAEFESKLDLFDKNEWRQAKEVYDKVPGAQRDRTRHDEVEALRKEAGKLAGKGMHADAVLRLDAARNAARELHANPYNERTGARGTLKKVAQQWKSEVSQFVGKLNELSTLIRGQADNDISVGKPTVDAAVEALRETARAFNPDAFDTNVENLLDDKLNITQQRAAKEAALQTLRNCRDTMNGDPLLAHIATNPFKPISLQPLQVRLKDLDLNLQRF